VCLTNGKCKHELYIEGEKRKSVTDEILLPETDEEAKAVAQFIE